MKKLLLGVGLLAGISPVAAQTVAASDTSLLLSAVRAARQRAKVPAESSHLINGVAYSNNAPSYVTGRPFFLSGDPQPGTLDYDGQHFDNVELLYEQVLDQVLLYGPAQAAPLQLIRQQVRGFELAGHRFVHLPADSAKVLNEGFYDVVVDGPTRLLVKRAKKLEASTGGYNIKGEYEQVTRFFVQRQGRFYEVSSLRQVLAALADKRAEMQAHARSHQLSLTADNREASLTALLRQYNSLTIK